MLISNHPDDERLSALASRESDPATDAALTAHVSSCVRCTGLVDELGALRAALAELPDLAPHRPLRLLPPVDDAPASAADRLGGWVRRFFAPVIASGAALALVGTIGTAAPALSGMAAGGAAPSADERVTLQEVEPQASAADVVGAPAAATAGPAEGATADSAERASPLSTEAAAAAEGDSDPSAFDYADADDRLLGPNAERSPWPMVLFAGVALMVGALLLRWILVPRVG